MLLLKMIKRCMCILRQRLYADMRVHTHPVKVIVNSKPGRH